MSSDDFMEITLKLSKEDIHTIVLGSYNKQADIKTNFPEDKLSKLLAKLYLQALEQICAAILENAVNRFGIILR